ncbi:MAG: 1-acyl-sn-glycerol-3-phosphate acyltransferase [Rhodobacteraceae bacterium]|jgi:glycerol-3-phosphate O-acyltransferase|nr:1-acyl-sn-glycerol-3-phosphate acyltransferase [Paracoccaceae bacterium]
MTATVTLPLWLFVLILGFAAVTFASHFLFPSVRWFLRRRLERAVAELNKRLKRPIAPFKIAQRADTIQRLVYDRDVLAAVAAQAIADGVPEAVAHERARRYAREIVPSFSALTYFGFAARAARWLSNSLYDVRVTHLPGELDRIDPAATVVFVMNHRSNMDYVLVTHLVADRVALSYAVGEWAQVWPLSRLIRAMGAYFIRRKYRSPLYRTVLARYVSMATGAGVTQAVFPEGGLSLDGRPQVPKVGILSDIVQGAAASGRDVVFMPVALNYDRVLEDRVLIEAARTGERRFRASLPVALSFAARHVWMRLTGRFRKFGQAAVGFGAPLSLAEWRREHGGEVRVGDLANHLMARVAAVTPRLPVPCLAAAMLAADGPLPEADLVTAAARDSGVDSAAIVSALDLMQARGLVRRAHGTVSPVDTERPILSFYAASAAPPDRQG